VRNGMLNACGRIVLFTDADLSSPIEEAPKLLKELEAGADVATGSRWLRAETQIQRQPLHRQLCGRIFNLLLRITLGLQFKDKQCGFKAFRRRGSKGFSPCIKSNGGALILRFLFLACKFGFKVLEVPVVWDTATEPVSIS